MPFSRGSPSLATVCDRLRVIPPRKRDCLKDFVSDLGVGRPSVPITVLFPELVMRKKFLILCGKSLELFVCREELDRPEKFRFSLCIAEEFEGEELKSWVIVTGCLAQ